MLKTNRWPVLISPNVSKYPQDRLEELRALNRANFEATGEYMTDVRIHIPEFLHLVI
jgi:hypothetical protein